MSNPLNSGNLIDSLLKLELVSYFHDNPYVMDGLQGIASWVGRRAEDIQPELAQLVDAGIVDRSGAGDSAVYSFNQESEHRELVDSAAESYKVTREAVRDAVRELEQGQDMLVRDFRARLAEQRGQTVTVLNSLADAVVLLDREHNILLCNERLLERFSCGSEVGDERLESIAGPARDACLESLSKLAADDGSPVPLEHDSRYYQVTSFPVSSPDGEPICDKDGNLFATVTAFRDVTRDREIEKMRDEFIYMLTHDLKNPLGIILGSSTLILDGKLGPLTEKQHRLLNNVVRSCQSMERIVQDFLTLSKIEAGRLELRIDRVNLNDMIQSITQMMQQQFREKDLKISVKTDYDHVYVQADSMQLERVVVNLISNAVKYNREGGAINIRTGKVVEGGFILTEIEDNGIGIPAEDMPTIFDKFKRAGTGEVAKGTGLGLAIARNLIESMGGRIWAVSTESKGSCFSFTLPQPKKQAS